MGNKVSGNRPRRNSDSGGSTFSSTALGAVNTFIKNANQTIKPLFPTSTKMKEKPPSPTSEGLKESFWKLEPKWMQQKQEKQQVSNDQFYPLLITITEIASRSIFSFKIRKHW
jgi:hypothetical protein